MQWHKDFGFNITVYDNGNNGDLSKLGINVIDYPGTGKQMPAYQDFMDRMNLGDWVLFCDIDEFYDGINPEELVNSYGNCDCIRLNWKVYGDCGELYYRPEPVWTRFQSPCELGCIFNDKLPPGVTENNHIKAFYRRTFKPSIAGVHTPFVYGGIVVNTKNNLELPRSPYQELCYDKACIRHYLTKSLSEYLERRLNTVDACGNVVATNEELINRYKNLNGWSDEKQKVLDDFLTRASNTMEHVCVQSELKHSTEPTKTRKN